MTVFPLTPGLLISMAMRYNNGFGMPSGAFQPEPLCDRQIRDIRAVALKYPKLVKMLASRFQIMGIDSDQVLKDEITGKGYYAPEKELVYRSWACDEALLEAIQLATDKVTHDGPKPSVTMDEVDPETGQEFTGDQIEDS